MIIDYQDHGGNSLLHMAIRQENLEMVKLLLQRGVEVETVNKFHCQTAFQVAYENGLIDICKAIQEHTKVDIEEQDDKKIKEAESAVRRFMDQRADERSEKRIFQEVIVHLDFKGAPPTLPFLKDLITFIGTKFEKLVTGILFEMEDTFPYDGNLKPLRGPNVYSPDDIKEILDLMRKHDLKFIPLV